MAIVFSPVTQDVLEGAFQPRPRHAFVMAHSGDALAPDHVSLLSVAVAESSRAGFVPLKATEVPGTGDYLEKIIGLVRGCGFGVAVFSPYTPPPTLGNIFFEVGLCTVFGKPVVILKTEETKIPSDFVRTEWVSLGKGGEDQFRKNVRRSLNSVRESAEYFRRLGDVALAAERVDYELAFERYKQAILIRHDAGAVVRTEEIRTALEAGSQEHVMDVSRTKLLSSVREFLSLLPA